MASNNGKVSRFCAPSQELESEWPPGPHRKPSAVGPRDSAVASEHRRSKRRASELPLGPFAFDDDRPLRRASTLLEPSRRRTWKHFGWGDRALIVALLVAVIGGYALVMFG